MLNLNLNYPSVPQEMRLFLDYCRNLTADAQYSLLHPPYRVIEENDAAIIGNWLHFSPADMQISSIPSANSGLTAVTMWFRGKTASIASEPFTFPGFRLCTEELGIKLEAVAADDEGMLPDALEAYLQHHPCKLVYMQPTVQNPTCAVMSRERREAIIKVVRSFDGVYILEDDAYRFLHAAAPPSFLQLAPDRTIHIYSLSKPFNPFLKSGFLVYPKTVLQGVDNLIKLTTSGTSLLYARYGLHLLESGKLTAVMAEKQKVAAQCFEVWQDIFSDIPYRYAAGSFHYWLPCQNPDATVKQLLDQQIDVSHGGMFSLTDDNRYIRVALGTSWDQEMLPDALRKIAASL